jgi:cytochrome c biogenesis protein CcmG/thiol:disulfide interchange protein DsbE
MSNKPNRPSRSSTKVRAAANAGGGGSTVWLWVGLAAVIVVAGIVAVMVSRSSGSGPEGGSASPSGGTVVPAGEVEDPTVEVSGTPLPAMASGGSDAAIGMELPTIQGETFDGSSMAISGSEGSQVVMAIAHWCPHCRAEVPDLQDWLDSNGMPSDVALSSVATDNRPGQINYPAGEWLRGEGWSVPTMVDDSQNAAAAALGVTGYPTFVVVGPDGTVVTRASGEISIDTWEALLEAARTGQPPA